MNWNTISSAADIENIKKASNSQTVLIFKHSTRCSISSIAKTRLESDWNFDNITPYYLDLIAHRDLSAKIAEDFKVYHESPQIILIKNGEAFHDASHLDISVSEISDVTA